MSDHHDYLAILKASYDYEPQSEDELAISENQVLLLQERVDDDWWKVRIKSHSEDEEAPSGLVPAAYVEPADHVSAVKVLYDYEASAPGELTVKEDELLFVYETDQDWLLVQSQKDGGKAGYVPGNYVEATSDAESTSEPTVDVPSARPVSVYVDPADRVASSKASQSNADPIKTWSVTDIDKKGKKKKGTLGIGNGSIFFASESDKTPVQKWQTSNVRDAVLEKGKQIRIEIEGSNPANLHYNAGSKDNAEAIQEKLKLSMSLSSPRASQDSATEAPQSYSPPPASSGRKIGKKASVHFSQSDPVIIPPREEDEEEDAEEDTQYENGEAGEQGQDYAVALYDFTADGEDELTVQAGEQLVILEKDGDEWWKCRNLGDEEGVVPASYLEETTQPTTAPSLPARPNVDAEREIAEAAAAKAAREAEERAEKEQVRKEQVKKERVKKEREEKERAEKERREREEEQARARKKQELLEAEKKKRKEASSPVPEPRKSSDNGAAKPSTELNRPPPDQVRTWHDRSGQFRVEAAYLGLNGNKVRLHKVNGVIVEVPTEKMSLDDVRYIEKLNRKSSKSSSSNRVSDDDVPLALSRNQSSSTPQRTSTPKKSNIDWFEFFLSAGCDVDDCSRYAGSFEKDKIDETLLPDITESTLRTLGLREGDILRVFKAIEKKGPGNRNKSDTQTQEQIRRDEELAKQLQAQETGGSSPRSPAPNLFAGPGGVLKAPRRRPQPTKSLPPSVDINALSSVSSSPPTASPAAPPISAPVQQPAKTGSATPPVSRFEDDAWTNRPSSARPVIGTPPSATPRAPSAPPASNATAPLPTVAPPVAAAPTPPPQSNPANALATTADTGSLAKTTEADIFDQLARLSELRKSTTPTPAVSTASPTTIAPPPIGYHAGLGMGSSTLPIGQHLQNPQLQSQYPILSTPSPQPQLQTQPLNGPRGPFAPVPANQSLLQPLVPTRTGFTGFIPTRPVSVNAQSSLALPSLQQPFLSQQPTGIPNQLQFHPQPHLSQQPTGIPNQLQFHPQPHLSQQPTGIPNQLQLHPQPLLPQQPTGIPNQALLPQATGVPFNSFTSSPFQSSGNFGPNPAPMQPQFTGFSPSVGPLAPNNFSVPPVPPLPISPSSNSNNTSPANVFAQMKSGTFANEDHSQPQPADKYSALRPAPIISQSTGWTQPYQNQFMGYPR